VTPLPSSWPLRVAEMYSLEYFTGMMRMPGHGLEGQERLRSAVVLVVGLGGLGCPASTALAYSGTGTLRLVDPDTIEKSNLNRQFLYGFEDVGTSKVEVGARRLRQSVPGVRIEPSCRAFADADVQGCSLVLDCTDSMDAKKAISHACQGAGVALVTGAIYRNCGQISTFAFDQPATPGLHEVFDLDAQQSLQQSCSTVGVYGAHCMAVGALMGSEALRYLLKGTNASAGHLLVLDTETLRIDSVAVHRRHTASAPSRAQPETLEGSPSVISLQSALETGYTVIDVRTALEYQRRPSGFRNVPMRDIILDEGSIPLTERLAFICESGARARVVCEHLILKTGLKELRFIVSRRSDE
jgi:molybdopterin/thiamine biosynthesis adenylyltransferase/rhodanese-related sulfurtransferase